MVQGTVNGYGERCGNANLVSIIPSLALKMGYDALDAGAARRADRAQQLRGRDREPPARRLGAVRRHERVRPQGRDAPAGHERRRPRLRAHRPGPWSATTGGCWCPSCRAAARSWPRRASWGSTWTRTPSASPAILARAEGPGARGLPLRGRGRLVRAAASSARRGLRAALHARELPRDHREARRRPRRDRGHGQGVPRRRAARRHRRGQRPGQRARRRAAPGARRRGCPSCATSSSSTSRSASSTRPRAPAPSPAC